MKTTTKAKGLSRFVKDFFLKHELDIQSIGSAELLALLLCWEINLGFCTDETRDSTLARYSLVSFIVVLWHQNFVSEIEESP